MHNICFLFLAQHLVNFRSAETNLLLLALMLVIRLIIKLIRLRGYYIYMYKYKNEHIIRRMYTSNILNFKFNNKLINSNIKAEKL